MTLLPAAETNTEPPIWQHDQSATFVAVGYTGPPPSQKGQHFVLTGIDTCSGYRLTFPTLSSSPKTTTHGLTECLTHYHVFKQHCFWSWISFHSTWSVAMGPYSWNSLVLSCFPSSWSSWVGRSMEWLYEGSITVPSGWQYLQGWGMFSRNLYILYISIQYMVLFLL